GQEDGWSGEVLGLPPAPSRDALENSARTGFVMTQRLGIIGGDIARRDGIDVDATAGPLIGEGLGQLGDASLAGGIAGYRDSALERQQRSAEHDLAMTTLAHCA